MGARKTAFEKRLVFDIGVAGNQRVLDGVEQSGQFFRSIVELVIADGHKVDPQAIGEFRDDLATILGVEQRTLEPVAGVEQDDVFAFEFGALVFDRSLDAGDATKALTGGVRFRVAVRIRTGDRAEARMEIVEVKDV